MSESESYQVSATEFAALDALGETFRQLAHFELDQHRWAPETFTFAIDGTATLSHERAAAVSAWLRMLRSEGVDQYELGLAACWVIAWGRNYAAPRESEHPNAMMPGSFTTRLLDALHAADGTNREKLRRQWPMLVDSWELWCQSNWAELHRRCELVGVRARVVRASTES